jgi:hypothetical protein
MTTTTVSAPIRIDWANVGRLMRITANGRHALAVPTTGDRATREAIMSSAAAICSESERVALALWLEAESLDDLTPVVTVLQQFAEITGRPVAEIEADFATTEWEIIDRP